MKFTKIFSAQNLKLVGGISLILSGVLLYTSIDPNENIFANSFDFFAVPVGNGFSFVSNNFSNFFNDFKTREDLNEENKNLKNEISILREKNVNYLEVLRENERFKKLYNIKKNDKNLKFVPASVIGSDPGAIFYNFKIDEGRNAGISLNDAVITTNGFVGYVEELSGESAKVRTILAPNSKVGVLDTESGESGIISGAPDLAKKNLTQMMFISAQTTMKEGCILVTTGLSGLYPKNLKLGKVKSFEYDSFEAAYYALVEPFEDIKKVKEVFVVTDFRGKGDFKNTALGGEKR